MALPTGLGGLVGLDRGSPVPLYFQLAEALEAAIGSGRLPAGSLLDNESALAEQLGLSRATIRRALQALTEKGLLLRRRGVGTQVVRPLLRRRAEISSLYDDLRRSGRRPATRVLAHRVEPASAEVGAALGLPADAAVVVLERLRYAEDEPIARLCNFLDAGLAPLLTPEALEQHGLYALLRSRGITLATAAQTIGARQVTPAEARQLGERPGAPLLTVRRTAYDEHGHAVEYGSHVYRADRYAVRLSMLRR
jgi:DNA-binding GntR family transcriptional regulator